MRHRKHKWSDSKSNHIVILLSIFPGEWEGVCFATGCAHQFYNCYVCTSLCTPRNLQNVFWSPVMLIPNQLGQFGQLGVVCAWCDSSKQIISYDTSLLAL